MVFKTLEAMKQYINNRRKEEQLATFYELLVIYNYQIFGVHSNENPVRIGYKKDGQFFSYF